MKFKFQLLAILAAGFVSVATLRAANADLRVLEAAKNQDREAVRTLLRQHADVNARQPDGATALAWAAHWDDLETVNLLIAAGAKLDAANDYGVTPLWLASSNRSAAMVETLLKAGANPNLPLWTGETPLMTAVSGGNMEVVKSLLAHGANVNVAEPRRGQTALMWAVAYEKPEIAKLLIEKGADVRARTHPYQADGFTPMVINGYAGDLQATPEGGYTPLLFAARVGDMETAKLLVEKGANPNEASPEDGNTLVLASAGGFEELALFLLDKGADPNSKDSNGLTPLHYAMRDGIKALHGIEVEKVARVCQNGAGARCVAADDAAAITALDPSVLQALKAGQALPTTDTVAQGGGGYKGGGQAQAAADGNAPAGGGGRGNRDEILPGRDMINLTKALLAHGADPNAPMLRPPARLRLRRKPLLNLTGATPFMLAAASNDMVAMRTLVEGRAKTAVITTVDPVEFNKTGFGDDNQIQGNGTPLMVAIGLGRENDFGKAQEQRAVEVAKVLLGLGANVNDATETGWTAMHAAAFLGADAIIEFLVQNGANVNVVNGCGQTPLTLSEGTSARGLLQRVTPHPKTSELLRKLGAIDNPPAKPVGRCIEGRFGLDYAVIKPGEKPQPKSRNDQE